METPPDSRAAVLADACNGDDDLIKRVEAIIAASEDARFLAKPDFKATVAARIVRQKSKRSDEVRPANCDVHHDPRS